MTTNEAIERLREFCKLKPFCELYPDACRKEECEIHLAIEALENLPSAQPDLARDIATIIENEKDMRVILKNAQPERKKGEWIEKEVTYLDALEAKDIITEWQSAKCSACGKYHTTPYMYYFDDYDYCPNCGSYNGGKKK